MTPDWDKLSAAQAEVFGLMCRSTLEAVSRKKKMEQELEREQDAKCIRTERE